MKNLIVLSLVLATLTGISQTDNDKQDKWKIGITMSPDIFLNSTSLTTGELSGYDLKLSGFHYTIGFIGLLAIKPKLYIGTGISFSQKDFSGTYYCHVCDFISQGPETIKQRFIEIPLFVRYNIVDKKFGFHVETGFINGFLVKDLKPKFEEPLSTKKYLLSGQFGLGIDIDLGQRINISLTSTYKHSITNFSDTDEFKFRSFGFMVGVVYRIKNSKNGG